VSRNAVTFKNFIYKKQVYFQNICLKDLNVYRNSSENLFYFKCYILLTTSSMVCLSFISHRFQDETRNTMNGYILKSFLFILYG
jgi:hypothetical protein